MTLTEEQIAEIRARAEAATPGPWAYESVSEKSNDYCVGIVCPVDKDGNPGDPIMGNVKHHPHHFNAETGDFGEWYYEMVCSIDEGEHDGDGSPHDDARFIAHAREDIPALLAALEAARSANRPRDDYPVFCSDCGRAHVLDTVLPSEIWNKIASPDDLLCVVCIDTRLKKAGLTAEAEFYYSGDALRSRLYGDADALEAANKRAEAEAVREAMREDRDSQQRVCIAVMTERDALRARVAELEEALTDALFTMNHARVFIRSREKMHPDGQTLYAETEAKIDAALKEKNDGQG